MKRALAVTTLALVSFVFSCGGGKTGDTLRPKDPNAKDALKEPGSSIKACKPAHGEPLVVDLKSNERSDFELAMEDGVAVVSYDCRELHLLKSCSLHDGQKYNFTSVTVKEDVVQLQSKDEVEANIPITGAKLSAALESGSTLELALITVGKKRYKQAIYQDDLKGSDCDRATHIIRGAFIGAFAMGTGTVGQASAVAEMFGAGVGGSSVSKRRSTTKDGDLEACRSMAKGATKPPDACQAITRLDLSPIKPGKNPDKAPPTGSGTPDQPPTEPPMPPIAEQPTDPMGEPASKSVSDSKSSSSKPANKTAAKKPAKPPPKKPGGPATASAPSPGPSLHAASAAAAPAPRHAAESADVDETPSCPEGLKWNGVVCKKQ